MKGIVLISHGDLAKGMAQSATFFMGDLIEQLECCCLRQDDSPEKFGEDLKQAIERADSGEGVIVLADLFGGTPCNQVIPLLNSQVDLIVGMNFPLVLELLNNRMGEGVSVAKLTEMERLGIVDVKELIALQTYDEKDE